MVFEKSIIFYFGLQFERKLYYVFFNSLLKGKRHDLNKLRNRCSDRTFNFLKEGDLDFIEFRRALDGRIEFLTSQGIRIKKKAL